MGMKDFSRVPTISRAQSGNSLADISVDGANSQAQFERDLLGGFQPIDMTEAFALSRRQAPAELSAQFCYITNGQNCAACRQMKASSLRSPKQHLLFPTRAYFADGGGKRFSRAFRQRSQSATPLNFNLTRESSDWNPRIALGNDLVFIAKMHCFLSRAPGSGPILALFQGFDPRSSLHPYFGNTSKGRSVGGYRKLGGWVRIEIGPGLDRA